MDRLVLSLADVDMVILSPATLNESQIWRHGVIEDHSRTVSR